MDIQELKSKYYGSFAATYDEERTNTPLWRHEQAAVRQILSTLPRGSSILDVPIGTGRFLPLYDDFGLDVTGVDASTEMLHVARSKSSEGRRRIQLFQGDIFSLSFPDKAFDTALCVRFLGWLREPELRKAVTELTRVSRHTLVLGLWRYRPLSEVNLLSANSIKRHLRQLKLRFYNFRTHSDFIYHKASVVRKVFADCGLEVAEKLVIPTKEAGDYSIYFLRKT